MIFFKTKEEKTKDFLVIGAGRFGSSVAKSLHQLGKNVLLVDKDEDKLQDLAGEVTHTIITEITDERSLKSLELNSFDVAIVAIGKDLNNSILVTLLLKEAGIKTVICKAVTEIQAKTLYKLGASSVIFPERDTGIRVANNLASNTILDSIDIDPKYSLLETRIPESWIGKTIIDLDIRNKYDLNVLAIKTGESMDVTIDPNRDLLEGDILILLGERTKLNKLFIK